MRKLSCIVLASVLLPACPDPPVSDRAPVSDGSTVVYRISQRTGGRERRFSLWMSFNMIDERRRLVVAQSEHGTRSFRLDQNLMPLDESVAEFGLPVADHGLVQPGLMWLPPPDRKLGLETPAGKVEAKEEFQQWKTWRVELRPPEDDPENPAPPQAVGQIGTRWYEAFTGMLVAFEIDVGDGMVTGALVRAY